jgi:hypothetical protein
VPAGEARSPYFDHRIACLFCLSHRFPTILRSKVFGFSHIGVLCARVLAIFQGSDITMQRKWWRPLEGAWPVSQVFFRFFKEMVSRCNRPFLSGTPAWRAVALRRRYRYITVCVVDRKLELYYCLHVRGTPALEEHCRCASESRRGVIWIFSSHPYRYLVL